MTVTDADRVAAEGVRITLSDGSERTLKFDLRAFLQIEGALGSIAALAKGIDDNLAGGGIKPLLTGLAAGIQGDPAYTEDSLLDVLDSRLWGEYRLAALTALTQALPEPRKSGKDQAQENGSPGPTSTDSPVATSAAATTTSSE